MKLVPKGYLRIIGTSILDVCQLAWTLGRQWLWSSLKQDNNKKTCTLDGIQMQLLGQEQKNTWKESMCGFDIGYSAILFTPMEDVCLSRLWFHFFYFHPYLGKWSNLTNLFQMGWNHQLVVFLNWDSNVSFFVVLWPKSFGCSFCAGSLPTPRNKPTAHQDLKNTKQADGRFI